MIVPTTAIAFSFLFAAQSVCGLAVTHNGSSITDYTESQTEVGASPTNSLPKISPIVPWSNRGPIRFSNSKSVAEDDSESDSDSDDVDTADVARRDPSHTYKSTTTQTEIVTAVMAVWLNTTVAISTIGSTATVIKTQAGSTHTTTNDGMVVTVTALTTKTKVVNKKTTTETAYTTKTETDVDVVTVTVTRTTYASFPTTGNYALVGQANIPLLNVNGYSYSTEFVIGGQSFDLIVDTGSGDLWVSGESCNSTFCEDSKRFNSSASSTFEDQGKHYSLYYVSGSFTADIVSDTVAFGGISEEDYLFGLATVVSDSISDLGGDGIAGFAFTSAAGDYSYIKSVVNAGLLTTPIFSFFLNRNKGSTTSVLTLGGYDTQYYTGSLNWVDSTISNDWAISITATLGDDTIASSVNAYVDSGTTAIIMPADVYDTLSSVIPSETVYCSTLPDLNITISGVVYSLTPKQYSFYSGNACYPNIFSWSSDSWILGAPFLQNVYASFNVEDASIGFAPVVSKYRA